MICKKCGAEIESGLIYCPSCGESIQLVPNYDVLEEELLSRVVEDKDKSKDDRFATGVYKPVAKPPVVKPKTDNKTTSGSTNAIIRNKDFLKKIIAFLVIVFFGVIVIIPFLGSHSYDSLMNKAIEAESNKQYAKALGYFEEAYNSDKDSFEAIYGVGRMYYKVKEYDKAIEYLSLALDYESDNKAIYTYLVDAYSELGDMEGIYELMQMAPNDDISSIFSEYITSPPEFSLKGGEYEGEVELELTVSDNKKYQIFYTLDGKNPTTSGKLYSKSIKLAEGETVVKAVTLNDKGEYSEVVSETYNIKAAKVAEPVVSPAPGTYTEQVQISIEVPEGCKAYYTWDGTNPKNFGTEYTGPFSIIKGSSVLSIVIVDDKGNSSSIFHGDYIYNP
ncbi:TPR repeat-containing protein [Pseudobutyrivibrio sp. YE44]|uniref:chitobiase/beta-hexosaminidase C-terminal domain-containing protein n=1 Tax=Pseudobutyrivibrio sp. YE44 TaxID=1520802 RepID=UPI000880FCA0|nr:chitobiase/beta-hexosaminidase C-terminal domain-containing protein [Pseudobutyrivibrio sp. YE44]SDB09956.1 TPR repeat-containing protein [Pseudobutyrivibrio sp. YE44]